MQKWRKNLFGFVSLLSLLGLVTLPTVTLAEGSGTLNDLWQLSEPTRAKPNPKPTYHKIEPAPTIKAEPLVGNRTDRLASLNNSVAEIELVQRRVEAARQQTLALTSLETATSNNQSVLARASQRVAYQPRVMNYDVYGQPIRSAGYEIDESIVSNGGNYLRIVRYQPRVIYAEPYCYKPCYRPVYRPCYRPVYRPCYRPRYKRCGYGYGGVTIRSTGSWGYSSYRSQRCSGSSIRIGVNF